MKALALEVARFNITITNLLPERFDTDQQHQMAKAAMVREGISYEEARARQVESIAAKRLGDPREFGATCAFLCSCWRGSCPGRRAPRRLVSSADLIIAPRPFATVAPGWYKYWYRAAAERNSDLDLAS